MFIVDSYLLQALWLIKLLQNKSWHYRLHVRSAIDRFSESLIYWLLNLMVQSIILKSVVQFSHAVCLGSGKLCCIRHAYKLMLPILIA